MTLRPYNPATDGAYNPLIHGPWGSRGGLPPGQYQYRMGDTAPGAPPGPGAPAPATGGTANSAYWTPGTLNTIPGGSTPSPQFNVASSGGSGYNVRAHQRQIMEAQHPNQLTVGTPGNWYTQRVANDKNHIALQAHNAAQQRGMMNPQIGQGGVPLGAYGGLSSFQGGGSLADAVAQANAANETRYQDALGGYQNRYVRNMEDIKQSGAQEGSDIDRDYEGLRGKVHSSMVGRGLSGLNPGVPDALVERERQAAQGRLADRLRTQRIATDAQLSGDTLGFIERKEEMAPPLDLIARLAEGVGAYGGGALGDAIGGGGGYPTAVGMVPFAMGGGYSSGGGGSGSGSANAAKRRAAEEAKRELAKFMAAQGYMQEFPNQAAWAAVDSDSGYDLGDPARNAWNRLAEQAY